MKPESNTKLEQLFFWGRPFSPLYSCIMANRASMYTRGIFRQHKLDVPVISVGNLVLGGTGKTPLVHYIVGLLQQQNKRSAILSRGYKGKASSEINIVSDTREVLLDAEQAGDEPRLLAEKLPGTPVVTGKKRVLTGRYTIENFGIDCLILDDGYQHLSLQRDIDLVLFSADKLLGNGRVLPGGELREPISALKRADAFILSGVNMPLKGQEKDFIKLLNSLFPDTPVYTGTYIPDEFLIRKQKSGEDSISLSEATRIPVYGFCGIAQPDSFYNLLLRSNMNLVGFQPFDDHHLYSANNLKALCRKGIETGAQALVTTEKDLVKIRSMVPDELPIFTLPIRFQLGDDFNRFILGKLASLYS